MNECSIHRLVDGKRVCSAHKVELVELSMTGDNPSGLGHLKTWLCPASQKTMHETEGL